MGELSYDEYSDQTGLRRTGRGGRNSDPRGSALAARPHEGEGEGRSLAEGRGAKHGTSKMVCPRSDQVGGVSVALPGGTQEEQRTALALETRGGERHCHVSLWRQRSAAQRSRDLAGTPHSEMNSLFTRTRACRDGYKSLGAESCSVLSMTATRGRLHRPLATAIW